MILVYDRDTGELAANYGYQWWITKDGYTYYASGFGGQRIYIIPVLNMVIVMTAGNFEDSSLGDGIVTKITEALISKDNQMKKPILGEENISILSKLY